MTLRYLFFALLFGLLLSCSSDSGDAVVFPQDSNDLPDFNSSCADYDEGDVKFSAVHNLYFQCKGNSWVEVDVAVKDESSSSVVESSSSSVGNQFPVETVSCENGDILYSREDDSHLLCEKGRWIPYEYSSIAEESSSSLESFSSSTQTSCEEGDKLLSVLDSSYYQCENGQWVDLDEIWVIKKDTNTYYPVERGHFLPSGGFYSPFAIRAPKPLNGGVVRCSFDGSMPTVSSEIITESMRIDSTMSVRCAEFLDSSLVSSNTETFFVDDTIGMPVLAINTEAFYFDNYINEPPCTPSPCKEATFWEDVEFAAHVEYFAKGSLTQKKDFEFDAGLSIMGGYSRNQQKKSLVVTMRDEYQKGYVLKYPLFETRSEYSMFKAFNLRNNGNRFVNDYICDPMAVSLLEGTNVDYQRSRQVVVYINGVFMGIYDMRERLNEHFIETNYGIPSNQVEFIEHHGAEVIAKQGSIDGYKQLIKFLTYNDVGDTTTDAYEQVLKMLDVDNFMEYMAAEIYYHNGDWPHNNVRAWRTLNRPWKFIAYDIDHGFGWRSVVSGFTITKNMFEWIFGGGKPGSTCATKTEKCFPNIFIQLMKRSEFKRVFINRSMVLYAVYINADKISAKVDQMTQSIDPKQIERDMALYPRTYTKNCKGEFDADGSCLKEWAVSRDSTVLEEFRSALALGENIKLTFYTDGNGKITIENAELPSNDFTVTFFANHPILIAAIADEGSVFESWEDGSTENPRMVSPSTDFTFAAIFKKIE